MSVHTLAGPRITCVRAHNAAAESLRHAINARELLRARDLATGHLDRSIAHMQQLVRLLERGAA